MTNRISEKFIISNFIKIYEPIENVNWSNASVSQVRFRKPQKSEERKLRLRSRSSSNPGLDCLLNYATARIFYRVCALALSRVPRGPYLCTYRPLRLICRKEKRHRRVLPDSSCQKREYFSIGTGINSRKTS